MAYAIPTNQSVGYAKEYFVRQFNGKHDLPNFSPAIALYWTQFNFQPSKHLNCRCSVCVLNFETEKRKP